MKSNEMTIEKEIENISQTDEYKEIQRQIFDEFYQLDVSDKTETKNNLTYLSWAWAWAITKSKYPTATYKIQKDEDTKLPYVYDPRTGYMVFTEVTIEGLTYEMWLPVMDSANKAMKDEPYTYKVKEYKNRKFTGNYIDKTCEAADMFDINKTIMRCLVKNLAMFGVGLKIYAGEDLKDNIGKKNYASTSKEASDKQKYLINKMVKEVSTKNNMSIGDVTNKVAAECKVSNLQNITSQQASSMITKLKEMA